MLANIISRMSLSNYQEIHSLSLLAYQVLGNQVSPLTQSSLKANAAMLNLSLHMPDNSLDRWINQMLISLKVSLRRYLSIKNLQIEILALLSEQLLKFMITCVCSLLVPVNHTVLPVAKQSLDKVHNKLLIKFLQCLQRPSFKF